MMPQRDLGRTGLRVSAIGLGCMSMSGVYGPRDDEESTRTIHRALELGVTFIDTAEAYGQGHNEELVGKALKGRWNKVVLATKFGNFGAAGRDPAARAPKGTDYVRAACEGSLKRLGIECIDLYYLHRVDLTNPIEEVVGAMARLREQGKIKHLGLSEAGPETVRRAHKVASIAALQSEYSLWTRQDAEQHMLPLCRELGITYVAYSPLGRGFLSGQVKTAEALPENDRRRAHPRFQGEHIKQNLTMLPTLEAMAARKKCTPAQLALAWVLHQGADIVPIPGTKRRTWLEDNAAACSIALSPADSIELGKAFPPGATAGTRYPESEMYRVMV
jgi:aryl-alcohol dehydrogenase-like predicted oxidoreductase